MKKYMVVFYDREDAVTTWACFYDSYKQAKDASLDAECGIGIYTEIYERVTGEEDGSFIRRYEIIE